MGQRIYCEYRLVCLGIPNLRDTLVLHHELLHVHNMIMDFLVVGHRDSGNLMHDFLQNRQHFEHMADCYWLRMGLRNVYQHRLYRQGIHSPNDIRHVHSAQMDCLRSQMDTDMQHDDYVQSTQHSQHMGLQERTDLHIRYYSIVCHWNIHYLIGNLI